MLARKYLEHSQKLLRRFIDTQLSAIEQAAEMIAQATADGYTFYVWGGPHSNLPVQDIFFRAGGLATVNAIFTPGLSLEEGPIRITSFIEKGEGYGREFFKHIGVEAGGVALDSCVGLVLSVTLGSDVRVGDEVNVARRVAVHAHTGGAMISCGVGACAWGRPNRKGKIRNRPILVRPWASATPRIEPLRCTTQPKYTPTARTRIMSGIEP